MGIVYDKVKEFKSKYSGGVAWRVKKHCSVIEMHLNPGEEVLFAFTGQRNDNFWDMISTCVFALTNKRILIGQKRVFGYYLSSITPDLFNDLQVTQGLIFGRIVIDTIKEQVVLTNLDKHSLPEIETVVSEFMMKEKQKYKRSDEYEAN